MIKTYISIFCKVYFALFLTMLHIYCVTRAGSLDLLPTGLYTVELNTATCLLNQLYEAWLLVQKVNYS